MKKIILIILTVIVLIGMFCSIFIFDLFRDRKVSVDFEDCLKSGFPVMESYPRQCRDDAGRTFIEEIGNILIKTNLINLSNPNPNSENISPLKITGQARGLWFFEASFPIKIQDLEGKTIVSGVATAKDDWMTDDFVNFEAELKFKVSTTTKAVLILEKDNPSGLEENSDSLYLPIVLMPEPTVDKTSKLEVEDN
ncbi:MAG: Gmad2 immunoglobulin-like domain-containing protein [Minisyncoccia bacterium]